MSLIARFCLGLFLLASLAAAQDVEVSGEQERSWMCQKEFPEAATQFWVRKELDRDVYVIGFRAASPTGEETRLEWLAPPSGDWFEHPYLIHFTFPAVSREGPVVASVYEDGILRTKETVSNRDIDKEGRVRGSLSYDDNTPEIPLRIHGTTALVAVAADGDGRELTRMRFPLPDWARVDRLVREAIPSLDRDALDYRHKCSQWDGPDAF
jgi:hypothetical protein